MCALEIHANIKMNWGRKPTRVLSVRVAFLFFKCEIRVYTFLTHSCIFKQHRIQSITPFLSLLTSTVDAYKWVLLCILCSSNAVKNCRNTGLSVKYNWELLCCCSLMFRKITTTHEKVSFSARKIKKANDRKTKTYLEKSAEINWSKILLEKRTSA